MVNMKLIPWIISLAVILEKQGVSVLGYSSNTPSTPNNKCYCNYTEIYSELPYFLQSLGNDERFSFAFQGRQGLKGEEGPQGETGNVGEQGRKGERGDQGPRGMPGTSLVYNSSWKSFGTGQSPTPQKGDKGERGFGPVGRKGDKGECSGPTFTRNLQDGSYVEVKGQKGEQGKRGRSRKGEPGDNGDAGKPGVPGISIQGQKGEKGEPGELPNVEMLRGRPGPRGPPGPPAPYVPRFWQKTQEENSLHDSGAILIPMRGHKGEVGSPGLSVVGEKGEIGQAGPPGKPTVTFLTEHAMKTSVDNTAGTLAFVEQDDVLYIRVASGWKEIPLGRFIPDSSQNSHSPAYESHPSNYESSRKRFFEPEKPNNQQRFRHKKLMRRRNKPLQ